MEDNNHDFLQQWQWICEKLNTYQECQEFSVGKGVEARRAGSYTEYCGTKAAAKGDPYPSKSSVLCQSHDW